MKIDREKVQILRASAQMTIGSLCETAGITEQAYRRAISTGSRPVTIGKIAAALGVSVADIISSNDEKGGKEVE